jgi:Putative neutral zinc metallopeptidase
MYATATRRLLPGARSTYLLVLVLGFFAFACGDDDGGDEESERASPTPTATPTPVVFPDPASTDFLVLDPPSLSPEDVEPALYAEYEAAVDEFLADVLAFWEAWFEGRGEHWTPPIVYERVEEEVGLMCGEAEPALKGSYYCMTDNYVALGEAEQLLPLFTQVGPFAVAMVMSHEVGHAVQNALGLEHRRQSYKELQADCFAGVWFQSFYEDEGFPEGSDPFGEAFLAMSTVDRRDDLIERYQVLQDGFENGPQFCLDEFPEEGFRSPLRSEASATPESTP